MKHTIIDTGGSRSFPASHPLLQSQSDDGEIVIVIGTGIAAALSAIPEPNDKTAILIELGNECLGVHTGENQGKEGSNILGFNRFRLGDSAPSNLVELVRQPQSVESAIVSAKAVFECAGLAVALCGDFTGRIINRLVRPYFNAALCRLDEGLASADDIDMTLRLGLGYPEGPIALLERTGLAHHFDVTQDLFESLGELGYLPARRARVAKSRSLRTVR